ncbi:glycosyltransferase family 2 protein [Sporolactobacillus sp. THM7-7]|nr:glycosyltransferase family 2 protein [Sporolactobacillus sp. THM7-7]
MNDPLISVVVPVYNVELYLEGCIQSILHQTYTNLEVIAVNDGSTDGSLNVLKKLAEQDRRLKIFNKENGGQASARNFGLRQVTGDYLIMVDSDDSINPRLIERCLQVVDETQSDLVLFARYNVFQNGRKRFFSNGSGTTLVDAGTVPWNKFYRASLWRGFFFPEGFWYEDLGIVPVIVSRAKKIVNINEPLYFYQTDRASSQTNQVNASRFIEVQYMLDNVYDIMTNLGLFRRFETQLEQLYIDQLVRITLLMKMPGVKDRRLREHLTDEIISCMDDKFANWRNHALVFLARNIFKRGLLNLVISLYLNKRFFLGDVFWKLPKSLEERLKKVYFSIAD